MTRAPDLTPNPPPAGKTASVRTTKAVGASAERSAAGFASMLSGLTKGLTNAGPGEPEPRAGNPAAAADGAAVGSKPGDARRLVSLLDPAGPRGAGEAAESTLEFQTLDTTGQERSLVEQVAEQIATTLQSMQGDSRATDFSENQHRAEAGPAARDGRVSVPRDVVTLLADRAQGTASASTAGVPSNLFVTHRETHFAPVFAGEPTSLPTREAAAPSSVRGADKSPALAIAGEERGRVAPDFAQLRRLLSEQMTPGHAADAQESTRLPDMISGLGAGPGATRAADAAVQSSNAQTATPVTMGSAPAGAPGPVKVLHIQLQPADLGTLDIRMRLSDAGLELHIEASRPETAALLKHDREALAGVLRASGYAAETVTVSFADKGGAQGQASSHDGGQPPASGGRPDAQSDGAPREQGGRPDPRFPSRPDDGRQTDQVQHDQDQPSVAARHRGDLYL